jgi:hypothetical protein
MAYKLLKKFPENYSDDIISVIKDLTLPSGAEPFLQGSSRLKLNYPGDYDLAQYIPANKNIKKDFKIVINKLLKKKNVYIGDIKSGEIPELKVIPSDTNEKNYNERRQGFLDKIDELYKNGFITKKELEESKEILKPNLKNMDITIVKHDIRFEIIRWSPDDILNGYVNYRNHKVNLDKYLYGDNTTKIDVVAWVNGVRYSEISMIYFFLINGKPTNSMSTKYIETIKNEIPYLLYKKKYMKICKRINNLETYSANPNDHILEQFYNLFNSDLSLLNQVLGDISVLKFIIENIKNISKEKFEYEIDQMKYRLGNMTNSQYLKKETTINKIINELEKDVVDIDVIDKLETLLRNILDTEVLKLMKKWGFYPIPDKYMPSDFKSNVPMPKNNANLLYSPLLLGGKNICMTKKAIVEEHKELIPILKRGSKTERMKEGLKQEKELNKYLGKGTGDISGELKKAFEKIIS